MPYKADEKTGLIDYDTLEKNAKVCPSVCSTVQFFQTLCVLSVDLLFH
jgi:hypothetical protein